MKPREMFPIPSYAVTPSSNEPSDFRIRVRNSTSGREPDDLKEILQREKLELANLRRLLLDMKVSASLPPTSEHHRYNTDHPFARPHSVDKQTSGRREPHPARTPSSRSTRRSPQTAENTHSRLTETAPRKSARFFPGPERPTPPGQGPFVTTPTAPRPPVSAGHQSSVELSKPLKQTGWIKVGDAPQGLERQNPLAGTVHFAVKSARNFTPIWEGVGETNDKAGSPSQKSLSTRQSHFVLERRPPVCFVEFRLVETPPDTKDDAFDPLIQTIGAPVATPLAVIKESSSELCEVQFHYAVSMDIQVENVGDLQVVGTLFQRLKSPDGNGVSARTPIPLGQFSIPLARIVNRFDCLKLPSIVPLDPCPYWKTQRPTQGPRTSAEIELTCSFTSSGHTELSTQVKPICNQHKYRCTVCGYETHETVPPLTATKVMNNQHPTKTSSVFIDKAIQTETTTASDVDGDVSENGYAVAGVDSDLNSPDTAHLVEIVKLEFHQKDLEYVAAPDPIVARIVLRREYLPQTPRAALAPFREHVLQGCFREVPLVCSPNTPIWKIGAGARVILRVSKLEMRRLEVFDAGNLVLEVYIYRKRKGSILRNLGSMTLTLYSAITEHHLLEQAMLLPLRSDEDDKPTGDEIRLKLHVT